MDYLKFPSLIETIPSRCDLGEGLFVDTNIAAWVDINKFKIFIYDNELIEFKVINQPSVIFRIDKNELTFGSEHGICKLNLKTAEEKIINNIPFSINENLSEYRSNDGGYCGKFQYLGFMHKEDPDSNSGFIFLISDEDWFLIDKSIRIPNSFIDLGNGCLLISDSFSSEIWLFRFDGKGKLLEKKYGISLKPVKYRMEDA